MCVGNTSTNTRIRFLSTPPTPCLSLPLPRSTAICRRMQKDSSFAVSLSQFATSLTPLSPFSLTLSLSVYVFTPYLASLGSPRLSASQSGRPPYHGHVHLSAEWKPTPTMTTTTAELLAPATLTYTHTPNTHTHTHIPACYAFVFHCRMSNFSGDSSKSRIVLASALCAPSLSHSLSRSHTLGNCTYACAF